MADVMLDFRGLGASGFAAADLERLTRFRNLIALREAMANSRQSHPRLAATVPTIGAPAAASAIATGTTWQVSNTSGPIHANKYTFTGANWGAIGTTYPSSEIYKGLSSYRGNGTDPLSNPSYYGSVRFQLESPSFELYMQCTQVGQQGGFRLKVDGEYVIAGTSWGQDATNGALCFIPVTWGSGSDADRRLRRYELEFDAVSGFLGVRTSNLYKPMPYPVSNQLRVIHHGDSQVSTVVDSVNPSGTMTAGVYTNLRWKLGLPDYWNCGQGGTGWFAPSPKTASWANDRVAIDIVQNAPDIVIDHMGGNDGDVLSAGTVTQAQYQSAVELWLDTIIAANPRVLIFMFGPIVSNSTPTGGHVICRNAKQAAAAKYPNNVAFIDTFSDVWITGTGRKGAAAGNGNGDWAVGSDGAHFTVEGCSYVAERMFAGIAGAIPALIAANS